jgi:Ribbon-helix-helix protein, copG family
MADLNIRAVPEDVVLRLQEQARADGVSMSEFIRQTLFERASRATAAEVAASRSRREPTIDSRADFDSFYTARLHRRRSA